MTTAINLITDTARLFGAVRKGEALTADEAVDGLAALNDLLGSWSNDGLQCVARVRESFSVSSAASYTIGTGATLNTARPIKLINAFFRVDTVDYPLTIITDEEYESITLKTLPSNIPQYINLDNAYPTGTVRLYPQAAGQLHILSEKPITSISALSTTVDFPPGWNRALKYNLAVDWAPQFGESVSPEVVRTANTSLDSIRLAIAKNRPIKRSTRTTLHNNIYSGEA